LKDPVGRLFRLDPDFSCRAVDEGFIVSNGIAWSPDDRTMYFADSRAETVFAYDCDAEEGAIRNRRVFFSTREIEGRCDGATVDAEGFYWCALVHGGAIARIDPKGRLERLIAMPVKHVNVQLRRSEPGRALRDERRRDAAGGGARRAAARWRALRDPWARRPRAAGAVLHGVSALSCRRAAMARAGSRPAP
jgi:hypothetical protein